ncbi:programmed cell death protein 7 [Toxorhynchites rutilus septentrionalis]|uniref:programmed cell death protein 7 n=1 Tax=Toxorhynchites rutilus septentrionalis TaxID=329112 RepID=UPI002479F74A|nr:programmed cell death protein 7 [Toxorhynchites rutilus septentrionalis]
MASFPFFEPTKPPPPMSPMYHSVWNEGAIVDQQYVQHFLSTRKQRMDANCAARIRSIPMGKLKAELVDLVDEIGELSTKKEMLGGEFESQPNSEWLNNVEQLKQIQQRIENKLTRLNDSKLRDDLRKKLHARRKKRAWQKRRNSQLSAQRRLEMEKRETLHKQIDAWREEQRKLLQQERVNQQQLDFASCFLADVHRRKAACKRNLIKFEKLKESRSQRHLKEDSFCRKKGNDEKDIDTDLEDLTKTWTAKLSNCVKEEKELKDVLARRSTANFQRRVENEWHRTLFGDTIPKKFKHPLLGADRDREVLIEVRWAWDACLISGSDEPNEGSSIPLGWVLPPNEPLPVWAEYQVKDQA